jgi:hypothetical protein
MIIELKKFGVTLTSRQMGKEAFSAFTPSLENVPKNEKVEISFEEINTFSPSWADEFLTPLQNKFQNRLILQKSVNPSVKATLKILEETNELKFNRV